MSDAIQPSAPRTPQRIIVTDVDISFGRLIAIMIKFGLAAIPAAIIVSVVVALILAVLGAIFGGHGFMAASGITICRRGGLCPPA